MKYCKKNNTANGYLIASSQGVPAEIFCRGHPAFGMAGAMFPLRGRKQIAPLPKRYYPRAG